MYHSITFGTKNTWDDWHLIPKSRPVINPPTVKTNYVEIPGGDGVLDLSTALSGRPTFANRTGTLDFYVDNDFKSWHALYSEIMKYLHGVRMRLILEDDPAYYYEGRFSVNEWRSDKHCSSISIDYNVSPYKKDISSSLDDWIWDTFNFDTGVIRYYKDIVVEGSKLVRVIGNLMPNTVTISASNASMSVTFNGRTYPLPKGATVIKEILIVDGENRLMFMGNGTISIEYSGGVL